LIYNSGTWIRAADPERYATSNKVMNKEKIISQVGQKLYRDACDHIRQHPDKETPDVVYRILDLIWEGDYSICEKLEVFFSFYDDMPKYSFVADIAKNYHRFSEVDRQTWWSMARDRLSSGEYALEQPIAYSLWCDFFEDPRTVEEAWVEVSNETVLESVLRIALLQSGPVPYQLKRQVYDRLLPYINWHNVIFHSLYCSATDAYGQIDRHDACKLLSQLVITPPCAEYVKKFIELIGCSYSGTA
jgi:hypothetical protein